MKKWLCFCLVWFLTSLVYGGDFKEIGNVRAIPAIEIESSKLWIGGEVLDRDLCDYDAYKEYLGKLGAKKIRLQSGWAKCEQVKGQYDFAWLDHIVDDALSRGVQPWLQISYGNRLYEGGGGPSLGQGLVTSDEALEAFARFAHALVARFKDRVNVWEIWNESDLRHNRERGHGADAYGKLFIKIAEAVLAEQPDATIVALSMSADGETPYVEEFFEYLSARDKLHLVDVVTFHGYPRIPESRIERNATLFKQVRKYVPEVEFWQGETGAPSTFGSTGALSNYPWTEASQAKWNTRRALVHIGRDIPFSLFLLSEFVYNDSIRQGLNSKGILKINPEDFSIKRPKPAYYAYQHLTSIFHDDMELISDFSAEVVSDQSTSIYAWEHVQGGKAIAYWYDSEIPSDEDEYSEVKIKVDADTFKDPVLVNIVSGKVMKLPENAIQQKEKSMIFTLPCYDSPILLADKSTIPM